MATMRIVIVRIGAGVRGLARLRERAHNREEREWVTWR